MYARFTLESRTIQERFADIGSGFIGGGWGGGGGFINHPIADGTYLPHAAEKDTYFCPMASRNQKFYLCPSNNENTWIGQ